MIPVRIINDGVDEEDEQLLSRLQLEPVEGDSPNVLVQPNMATLIILDDDGKKIFMLSSIECRKYKLCFIEFQASQLALNFQDTL